jgi:N-acetylmuramoyl-L-alanine amidase
MEGEVMQIFIDGQKLPTTVRVSRDLLVVLKSMANLLNWGILYDTNKGLVYINTHSKDVPNPFAERPSPVAEAAESTRLLGKTICIDAGHGGSDPGAIGPTGIQEKDNTLAIALLLRDKLERNGAKVIMTRETDQDVAYPDASASAELSARVEIANNSKANIFISIHNDAFTSNTVSGTTCYHYGDAESIQLANCLQKNLVEKIGTRDRGVRFASFYVIRYTEMAAVLVEVAFISNPEEEVLLSSVEGRYGTAEGIFQGIVQYFRV